MKSRILIGLLGILALAGASAQAQRENVEVTMRVECRKPANTRGCTASEAQTWTAPTGRYIDIASLGTGTVNGYWLKKPSCGIAYPATFASINIPAFPHPISVPISFRASQYVESGAGADNIGKVAYVNCVYTVTTYPMP